MRVEWTGKIQGGKEKEELKGGEGKCGVKRERESEGEWKIDPQMRSIGTRKRKEGEGKKKRSGAETIEGERTKKTSL